MPQFLTIFKLFSAFPALFRASLLHGPARRTRDEEKAEGAESSDLSDIDRKVPFLANNYRIIANLQHFLAVFASSRLRVFA
jgi:hypothetical protein